MEAQAKLMRFLEDGEFSGLMEQGLFRRDLYFRLGVVTVTVPSLNERKEDILPLVRHFFVHFNKKFGRDFTGISPEAEEALLAHHWTGNVRELKNLVERAVLTGRGPELLPGDLGLPAWTGTEPAGLDLPPVPACGVDFPALVRAFERHYIEQALSLSRGNESEAARLLNMNHHTFRYRRRRETRRGVSRVPLPPLPIEVNPALTINNGIAVE